MFDRRSFLQIGGALGAAAGLPRMAFAAGTPATSKRLLFVIQRGAADGLHTLAPVGDPAFAGLRGDLAQDFAGAAKADATFAFHPALKETASLYARRQALMVHAVASPYRDRSHFDGQNVLETGGAGAYRLKDGWMNRLVGLVPGDKALALAPAVPMALRGPNAVSSYAPSALPEADDDLMIRIADLYDADPQLGGLWREAQSARAMAGNAATARGGAATGELAAKMMAGANGARIAMIETNGWDTHNGQRARLNAQLKGLDALLGSYAKGMGRDWDDTLVLVATEFGRTARVNGTAGTDHGTGAMAMLLGGAVKGGRVLADWPGLGDAALYEGRDLKPTIDLDALIASALSSHFEIDQPRLASALFPDTRPKALGQSLLA